MVPYTAHVRAQVVTANVAPVAPAATVTLGGALAAPLLLESATCAPPVGAAPLNVTVPVEEFPPATLVGFSESEERVGEAGTEDGTKTGTVGVGSSCATAAEIVADMA